MQLIIHEYLNKNDQKLVHYLSCQAVRRRPTACGCMLKGLGRGLGTYDLGLEG